MAAQADPLIAVADQFHLTAAEVTDALAALRKSKVAEASDKLRRTMDGIRGCALGVSDSKALAEIAEEKILEIQQAAVQLRMVAGFQVEHTPTTLLQKKVRSLQAHVDHIKTLLAQAAASPVHARFVRDSRATLPELWVAIDGLSEVK